MNFVTASTLSDSEMNQWPGKIAFKYLVIKQYEIVGNLCLIILKLKKNHYKFVILYDITSYISLISYLIVIPDNNQNDELWLIR